MRTSGFLLALALPAIAHAQAPKVERLTRGDTTIVRTTGNGTWGPVRTATEILRIGDGATTETTFGNPTIISALPNGGVLLFDRKALEGPVLRMFDANGRFVRNIGRLGSGPGEYRADIDVKATKDGRIWIMDVANARTSVFSPDGKFLKSFPSPGNSWSIDMLHPATPAGVYITVTLPLIRIDNHPRFPMGFLRIDTLGHVTDSLRIPVMPGAEADRLAGTDDATITADGRILLATQDRIAFVTTPLTGRRDVLLTELNLPRVRYSPAERKESEDRMSRLSANTGGRGGLAPGARGISATTMPPLPEFKQPIRAIRTDLDGRIWVIRSVASIKKDPPPTDANMSTYREPVVLDLFNADGTFLGEVNFPMIRNFLAFSLAGDFAWATVTGVDDVVYLVKFRIH